MNKEFELNELKAKNETRIKARENKLFAELDYTVAKQEYTRADNALIRKNMIEKFLNGKNEAEREAEKETYLEKENAILREAASKLNKAICEYEIAQMDYEAFAQKIQIEMIP